MPFLVLEVVAVLLGLTVVGALYLLVRPWLQDEVPRKASGRNCSSLLLMEVPLQRLGVGERDAPRLGPSPQAHLEPLHPADLAQVVVPALGLTVVRPAAAELLAHSL